MKGDFATVDACKIESSGSCVRTALGLAKDGERSALTLRSPYALVRRELKEADFCATLRSHTVAVSAKSLLNFELARMRELCERQERVNRSSRNRQIATLRLPLFGIKRQRKQSRAVSPLKCDMIYRPLLLNCQHMLLITKTRTIPLPE